MAKRTITVVECDRCQTVLEIRNHGDDNGWAILAFNRRASDNFARLEIGTDTKDGAHLCANCAAEIVLWWIDKATLKSEWKLPEAAPVRMRAALALDDINFLKDRIIGLIVYDLKEVMRALKDDPDLFPDAELPPSMLNDIKIQAFELIDSFANAHDLLRDG